MKKIVACMMTAWLVLVFSLSPISAKAETQAEESLPVLSLQYHTLEESEKWILDEVLADSVSEHVVDMEETSVPCTIGELIDRGSSSYLFYQDETEGGTVYTAAGYALTEDGSYVYFEFTSDISFDAKTVDLEIARSFGSFGTSNALC